MEKKDIIKLLDEALVKLGLKRKGNYWVHNGDEITKMVNLQKSQYSNLYYINYGFIIRKLELEKSRMHVESRLGSPDKIENQRIAQLLDLESDIADQERSTGLKEVLSTKLVPKIQTVNTEADLLIDLKSRPHLFNVPVIVKKHFHLESE